MTTKTASIFSAVILVTGIAIGGYVRNGRTTTELVGVPVRVAAVAPAEAVAEVKALPKAVTAVQPCSPAGVPLVGNDTYVAKPGDTLSDVATGLLGTDNKANRDAVVSANPSLQANPDLVAKGREYTIVPKPADQAKTGNTDLVAVSAEPEVRKAAVLRYTAKDGDTVTDLAHALMGADTQANRDAIVNANPSLKADPDRLLAGKTYRIVAPEGGLVAGTAAVAAVVANPTTQPDADQVVLEGQPRVLRYTAKEGDTVSSLAFALLGSDTAVNRTAIINNNASLKVNPDQVIEGKTYWIPAPVAAEPVR